MGKRNKLQVRGALSKARHEKRAARKAAKAAGPGAVAAPDNPADMSPGMAILSAAEIAADPDLVPLSVAMAPAAGKARKGRKGKAPATADAPKPTARVPGGAAKPRKSAFPLWNGHTLNGLARWMGRSGEFTAEEALAAIEGIGLLTDGPAGKGIGAGNVRGAYYAGTKGKGRDDATGKQSAELKKAAAAVMAARAERGEPTKPAPPPKARGPRKAPAAGKRGGKAPAETPPAETPVP